MKDGEVRGKMRSRPFENVVEYDEKSDAHIRLMNEMLVKHSDLQIWSKAKMKNVVKVV